MNDNIKQVILGSLLGDGYLTKIAYGAKNSRLQIAHSFKQLDYLKWKKNFFDLENLAGKLQYKRIYDDRYIPGYIDDYRFRTLSNNIFTIYRNLFYVNNKKIIHKDSVSELDELGLAIWFMDDAHKATSGYQFNTQCFTKLEVEFLIEMMENNFDIKCNYQSFDNIMYVPARYVCRFNSIVYPYVPISMRYKFILKKGPE